MDLIQNICTSNTAKEQITTWAATMPAYCFTELCPDPMLRRKGDIKKSCMVDEKIQNTNKVENYL